MTTLNGRTAVVTGSTSGIGLGIARALARHGANIMLNGFGDASDIEKIKEEITALGVKVAYSPADMSKPAEIRLMIADAEKLLGSVDILVNNAGIQNVQPIWEFDDNKWDQIMAINLSAAFHAIKAASRGMMARKWGRVINIASVHGLVASPFKSAYVSAKHGIVGLSKAAGADLAPYGITVNAVCPGYVDTPLVRKQIPEQMKAHNMSEKEVIEKVMLDKHAIKEFVTVDNIAETVLFLCGEAGGKMTGIALPVDGGWSAM
jgi:3-hydroxybutyrate dehydrogenase